MTASTSARVGIASCAPGFVTASAPADVRGGVACAQPAGLDCGRRGDGGQERLCCFVCGRDIRYVDAGESPGLGLVLGHDVEGEGLGR